MYRSGLFTALLMSWLTGWCTIYPVPSASFPTVQAGLNAVTEGDTVMVAVGTYAEELNAPARSFVLKGDVVPDTGDYPRPTVDPSTLPNPTMRHCLRLPEGSRVTIEDFRFRNGPTMYPRNPPFNGGIVDSSDAVTLNRCIFDSTSRGNLGSLHPTTLDHCRFLNVSGTCVQGSPLVAQDCLIEGYGAPWLAYIHEASLIERCEFRRAVMPNVPAEYELLVSSGRGAMVRNCLFGPDHMGSPAVTVVGSTLIEACVFQDVDSNVTAAIDIQNLSVLQDSAVVRGCSFIRDRVSPAIVVQQGFRSVRLEENTFADCSTTFRPQGTLGRSVRCDQTPVNLRHNRFRRLLPGFHPVVKAFLADSVVLQENIFEDNGWAVESAGGHVVEARHNWWGDASGPRSEDNLPGLGDSVGANVLFDPWCIDTACVLDATPAGIHPAASFHLAAFPNPFNSTTRIVLEVPSPTIVKVALFNLLGQEVRALWSGVVVYSQELTLDGSTLASGTYLIRADDVVGNRPIASEKVVLLK